MGVATFISIALPDSALLQLVTPLKYASLVWLFIQACIVIDIAHDVHAAVLRRAESIQSMNRQARNIHHMIHMGVSVGLLIMTALMSSELVSLTNCSGNIAVLHLLALVGLSCTLLSISERCNKGCLVPAMVGFYSMLCCYDAMLSTNPNTGYYYYNSCYFTADSALPPQRITSKLSDHKQMTTTALSVVTVGCVLYACLTGSPTVMFFFDRLVASYCADGSACRSTHSSCFNVPPLCGRESLVCVGEGRDSADTADVEDGPYLVYREERTEYRLAVEGGGEGTLAGRVADRIRYSAIGGEARVNTAASNSSSGSSSGSGSGNGSGSGSGGGDDSGGGSGSSVGGFALIAPAAAAEHSSLLVVRNSQRMDRGDCWIDPVPPSPSSSSSSTLHQPIPGTCDGAAADSHFSSPIVGPHYHRILWLELTTAAAYLSLTLTDWAGYYQTHTDGWRPADRPHDTVVIKLFGCGVVWVVYIAALASAYMVYLEHNKRLRQVTLQ